MTEECSSMGAAALSGDGELFRSRGAQLVIVEGDERLLMQSGDFVMLLVKNAVSQLAAVVAMVGELQWPVGRDSAVAREGEASFSFSLPGPLKYTVDLGSTASAADVRRLEKLVQEYGGRCASLLQETAAGGGQEQESSQHADPKDSPASKKRAGGDDISLRMVGRMQRARRMSAVAKVFSKSLERGAINAANHVESMGMAAPDHASASSPLRVPNLAFAGVDAVAKVVDAVETGGRTLLENAGSGVAAVAAMDPPLQRSKSGQAEAGRSFTHALSSLISSGWTLNKLGLLMLFRVITASMARHSGGSSGSGSSRSGSSSSSEFRRLLSSSSSSSSIPSKSPTTPISHLQGGAGATSMAASQPALTVGAAIPSSAAAPPPLFTSHTPRIRHSDMPPPSGPPPRIAAISSADSQGSMPYRIYKPRATPAVAATAPPAPPPFLPRPPRFQPPPQN